MKRLYILILVVVCIENIHGSFLSKAVDLADSASKLTPTSLGASMAKDIVSDVENDQNPASATVPPAIDSSTTSPPAPAIGTSPAAPAHGGLHHAPTPGALHPANATPYAAPSTPYTGHPAPYAAPVTPYAAPAPAISA
ncbi:hypothetical protein NEFER03_1188 [Nematocida sp. LUAm3]|nr:hypothetical protein NEFER03_1188 [Nematocida sp. LUAm3]KAI5175797.1 hypothetical protein NEFER02_1666 [Nematocida sp. LUAm2]KAI5178293.1 hypothetical protein NEFER01_1460 [Nematocida sp. LUAm1]